MNDADCRSALASDGRVVRSLAGSQLMCRWYLISGKGRITAFAGSSAARTFDIQPGDSGVIPTKYASLRAAPSDLVATATTSRTSATSP